MSDDIHYHDEGERYYYIMDFNTHPDMVSGDSITGVMVTSSEIRGGFTSDLNIETPAISGYYVGMWISGGSAHKTYKIEVLVGMNSGRILEGDGYIRVGD